MQKKTRTHDPRRKVIYDARSNRCHPPTSPNIAPATKSRQNFKENARKQMSRHFAIAGAIREWSEHAWSENFREWNRKSATRLATEVFFSGLPRAFSIENYSVLRADFIQKFTKCCTTSPSAAPAAKGDAGISPSARRATISGAWTSPSAAPATKSDAWLLPHASPAKQNGSYAFDLCHIWNVLFNAGSNECHPATSPNITPAMQQDSHA